VEFEWDEEKNAANIQKHGFDFADGEELFSGHSRSSWRRMRKTTGRTDGEASE
jgi:uncharacterized DUF497 family protein